MKVTIEKAIRNAEASLRMEGMQPSKEVLIECRKVLTGAITHEQYISRVREKYMKANTVK